MSNVFASDVQKQFFKTGIQKENRDSLPMSFVSEIDTENAEYIVNRYGSDVAAQSTPNATYRRATGFSYDKDKKSIDEYATVTDEILYRELMRKGFDIVADRQDKHAFAIEKAIHRHSADVTRKGAGSVLDNEVLAGSASAGTPITMSASNPDDVSATTVQILQEQNAYAGKNPYVLMTPKQAKFYNLFSMGAGFSTADKALRDGIFTKTGTRVIRAAQGFAGLDVIVTNEMPRTEVLTLSANMTAADTVTVNGVVFTIAAAPAAAGQVDLGASAEATIDNLVAAINNSSDYAAGAGAATDYYEVSQANRTTLDTAGIKARKLTASTMEVRAFTTLTVSEASTNAAFSGTVTEHMLAGAYNSTSICLPSEGMHVDEKPLAANGSGTGTHGYELTTAQMHDAVVWTKNAPKIIDIYVA